MARGCVRQRFSFDKVGSFQDNETKEDTLLGRKTGLLAVSVFFVDGNPALGDQPRLNIPGSVSLINSECKIRPQSHQRRLKSLAARSRNTTSPRSKQRTRSPNPSKTLLTPSLG